MPLDKSKLATLVQKQSKVAPPKLKKPMPPPAGASPHEGFIKPGAPKPAAGAGAPPAAKPKSSLASKLIKTVGAHLDSGDADHGEKKPAGNPGGPVHPAETQDMAALVEEAAQEAESGHDTELEDLIASSEPPPPAKEGEGEPDSHMQAPHWVTDAEKWDDAADAVGLGDPDKEARYEEPFVVTAYLYKKLGGQIAPDAAAEVNPVAGSVDDLVDEAAMDREANPDPEIEQHLKGYDPVKHGNPPPFVENKPKWEKAKEAVDPEGKGAGKYDEPYAVATYVYKKMGGKLKGASAPKGS